MVRIWGRRISKEALVQEEELSINDILAHIRSTLTDELNGQRKKTRSSDGLLSLKDLNLDNEESNADICSEQVDLSSLDKDSDVFVLTNPIQKENVSEEIFLLTADMRIGVRSEDNLRRQALLKMASESHKNKQDISLSPETEKQMRILLNAWLKKNLPSMIDEILEQELKK